SCSVPCYYNRWTAGEVQFSCPEGFVAACSLHKAGTIRRLSLAKLFRTGRTAGSSVRISIPDLSSCRWLADLIGTRGSILLGHLGGLYVTLMKRIFLNLAILDFLALLACFAWGFIFDPSDRQDSAYMVHFHLALWSTIGNLGVHCLIFIYFLGTGRWVKEVALAYELPDVPYPRLTRDLKRRTFPPALFAMLVPIATAASGLGAQMREWPGW